MEKMINKPNHFINNSMYIYFITLSYAFYITIIYFGLLLFLTINIYQKNKIILRKHVSVIDIWCIHIFYHEKSRIWKN